jgi:formate C-acetyltransferase
MTINIFDDELIVGRATSKRRAAPLIVEVNNKWYLDALPDMSTREWDTFQQISEEDAAKMAEFVPYWDQNCAYSKWLGPMPEYLSSRIGRTNIPISAPADGQHRCHVSPGVDIVVARGLKALREDVAERKARLEKEDVPDKKEKLDWLEAVDISIDALIKFSKRYVALAKEMAEKETNPERKAELLKIAAVCEVVPEYPASNFHEAIQSMWFTYVALMLEGWGMGMSFGRIDQYLLPIYEKDIAEGKITRDEAIELVSCLLINMNGLCNFFDTNNAKNAPGFPMISNLTIGGVTPHGKCAVNDLSYLVLEAEDLVRLTSEDIVIRVNRNTPEAFLMKACEVAKNLHGKFKFIGDDTSIQMLLSDGKPIEYARDYVVVGCTFPTVMRHSLDLSGDTHNLPMMLELALNNGRHRATGDLIGVETGDPRKFTSYEEVFDAYKAQLEQMVTDIYPFHLLSRQVYSEYCPCPFQSALMDGCIEKCVDAISGGTEYRTDPINGGGLVNVGDSLAAIKKAVFEDKSITMEQLIDALDANFEGYDEVLSILEKCPKYGNDDDFVDDIVNDVLIHFSDYAAKQKPFAGAKPNSYLGYATMSINFGDVVSALPDGHKAGAPLADGGLSPSQGKNVSGATATINSVAKLDHVKITAGSVLNMRFSPDALADDVKLKKFASLIRAYQEQGGFLIQFNVTSTDMLRDAQKHPERYRDLLIRVSTWSAYFVELPPEMQEDIIARLEFDSL